jgi:thiopurine S-methyltransferase
MEGPPFSVKNEELRRHYADNYDLTLMASTDVSGGLKGKCLAKENAWLLRSKRSIHTLRSNCTEQPH